MPALKGITQYVKLEERLILLADMKKAAEGFDASGPASSITG